MFIVRNTEYDEVNIEGYIIFEVDNRYGENADGNMGEKKIFVTDVTDITAYTIITDDEIELNEEQKKEAEQILISKFLLD